MIRRRGDDHGEEGHGSSNDRWLVSYADFITLMFAFFAVLYATSQKDFEKSKEFQNSIKRFLIKAGSFGESGQQMNQGIKNNTVIEPPIQTYERPKPGEVKDYDKAENFVDRGLTRAERDKYVLDVTDDDWGVRLTLPAAALYSPGSAKFRGDAMPFIEKLSALLAGTKRKILIEGHVAKNEKGGFGSTWDFASARATNMLRFIEKTEKIPSDKLAMASLADSRPLEQNHKPELNSRLEIVLLNEDMDF